MEKFAIFELYKFPKDLLPAPLPLNFVETASLYCIGWNVNCENQ